MRKIDLIVAACVASRTNKAIGNTTVECYGNTVNVYLHGNCIYQEHKGVKRFTLSGWNTQTTRARLRALGVDVRTKDFSPVYDGKVIDTNKWYNC